MPFKDPAKAKAWKSAWNAANKEKKAKYDFFRFRRLRARIARKTASVADKETLLMAEPTPEEQKKIIRALVRLKHSLAADREIARTFEAIDDIEQRGNKAQIVMTINDLLGSGE